MCEKRGSREKRVDRVLEYSKCLLWQGLNHLVRHDAVREGDGAAVIEHWTIDMMQFFQKNHPKYLMLSHYFIAGTYENSLKLVSRYIILYW